MMNLSEAVEKLEAGIETYVDQAIVDKGADLNNLPVRFFRRGVEDVHLRDRAWMIVYDTSDYTTTQGSVQSGGVQHTDGAIEVIFGCPGVATYDDSTLQSNQRTNWGRTVGSALVTRESDRRKEAVLCRNVAMHFVNLYKQVFNDCSLILEDDTIVENNPHVIDDNWIWWLVSASVGWRLTWQM